MILAMMPEDFIKVKIFHIEHHKAHLASSFFVSPYDKAVVFSGDGLGDLVSTMWGVGVNNKIKIFDFITFPHSLGLFYTALTQYLGFKKYGDEYKVMGLSAYGEGSYDEEFKKIIFYKDGKFKLNLNYFLHHINGAKMEWTKGEPQLERLYSDYLIKRLGPERRHNDEIEKRHKDIAFSLQRGLEEVYLSLLNYIYERYKIKRLVLSGGVAFNCVANGKIFEKTPFEEIYLPPSPGDGGLSIGAAFYVYNQILNKRRDFIMDNAYWGEDFSDSEILKVIKSYKVKFRKIEDEEELCRFTARKISEGEVVGWFQGRGEFGPRALGNRSILVDPRREKMKEILNRRIKKREPFRPFAPSVLEEKLGEYYENTHPSPFMFFTYKVKREKIKLIPAPTHIDGTGRVQTVSKHTNHLYWKVIKEFEEITGIPLILNTSFNENEPIVRTPEEAISCFLRTKMGIIVIGKYVIER